MEKISSWIREPEDGRQCDWQTCQWQLHMKENQPKGIHIINPYIPEMRLSDPRTSFHHNHLAEITWPSLYTKSTLLELLLSRSLTSLSIDKYNDGTPRYFRRIDAFYWNKPRETKIHGHGGSNLLPLGSERQYILKSWEVVVAVYMHCLPRW